MSPENEARKPCTWSPRIKLAPALKGPDFHSFPTPAAIPNPNVQIKLNLVPNCCGAAALLNFPR
jgi:hypothetical protein